MGTPKKLRNDFAFGAGGLANTSVTSKTTFASSVPDVQQLEPTLQVIFKGLQKRDSTTRAKATEELVEYLIASAASGPHESSEPLIRAFMSLYAGLVTDVHKKVRANSHTILGILVQTYQKRMTPYLSQSAPYWQLGLYDNDRSVSRTAAETFETSFPLQERRADYRNVFHSSILNRCFALVFEETPDTLSDLRFIDKDDADARYSNIASAALNVLASFAETNTLDQGKTGSILSDQRFFKLLKTKDSSIQHTGLKLLQSLLVHEPIEHYTSTLQTNIAGIVPHVASGNTMSLLNVLQAAAKCSPKFVFTATQNDSKKPLSARLLKLIKSGPPPGSPSSYWHELRVLLELACNCDNISESSAESILVALKTGTSHATSLQASVAKQQYAETCLAYISVAPTFAKTEYASIFHNGFFNTVPLPLLAESLRAFATIDLGKSTEIQAHLRSQMFPRICSRQEDDFLAIKQWTRLLCKCIRPPSALTMSAINDLQDSLLQAYSSSKKENIAYRHICDLLTELPQDIIQSDARFLDGFIKALPHLAETALARCQITVDLIDHLYSMNIACTERMIQLLTSTKDGSYEGIQEFLLLLLTIPAGRGSQAVSIWMLEALEKNQDRIESHLALFHKFLGTCLDERAARTFLLRLTSSAPQTSSNKADDTLHLLTSILRERPVILELSEDEAKILSDGVWRLVQLASRSNLAENLRLYAQHASGSLSLALQASIWEQVVRVDKGISIELLLQISPIVLWQSQSLPEVEEMLRRSLEFVLPRALPSELSVVHPLGSLTSLINPGTAQPSPKYDEAGYSSYLRLCIFLLSADGPMNQAIRTYVLVGQELLMTKLQEPSSNLLFQTFKTVNIEPHLVNSDHLMEFLVQSLLAADGMDTILALFHIGETRTVQHFYEVSALYRLFLRFRLSCSNAEVFEQLYARISNDLFATVACTTALGDLLSKTKSATFDRNKLSSDLTGSLSDDKAIEYLVRLNALLAHEDLEENLIPRQRLIFLVKNQLKVASRGDLDTFHTYELLVLMARLLPEIKNEYGSFWQTSIQWLQGVLTTNISDLPDLPTVYATLKLIAWFSKNYESNDDLSEYWITNQSGTEKLLAKTFCLCALQNHTSQTQTLCSLIASRLVRQIPASSFDYADRAVLPALIVSNVEHIQTTVFAIQRQIVQEEREDMIMSSALTKEYEDVPVALPLELLSIALECPLSEEDLETINHELLPAQRGFFMAWILIFLYFEDTPLRMRLKLVGDLSDLDLIEPLMGLIFTIFRLQEDKPVDISGISTSSPYNGIVEGDQDMLGYAVKLYYSCLLHTPSLVRAWWMDCKDRPLRLAVEQMTEKYYSLSLIQNDVQTIQTEHSKALLKDDNLNVQVSNGGRDIYTTYEIDEQKMEMAIRLPSNYPLRRVTVEGLQRVGVKDAQWRAWLLGSQAVLTAQNGSLLDAISLFQKNVSLHFEGVADCNICFSVLSVQDKSLPSKKCQTCKNLFHSSCLFKWFKSSSQSRCPLCRTSFVF